MPLRLYRIFIFISNRYLSHAHKSIFIIYNKIYALLTQCLASQFLGRFYQYWFFRKEYGNIYNAN